MSVRVSICNWENLLSNALKRAIRLDEREVAPRRATSAPSASTSGKIEMETLGDGSEDKVLSKLVQKAVLNIFNRSSPAVSSIQSWRRFRAASASMSPIRCPRRSTSVRSPKCATPRGRAEARRDDPASTAAALEFVLEGLHLSRKLNKDSKAGRYRYRS